MNSFLRCILFLMTLLICFHHHSYAQDFPKTPVNGLNSADFTEYAPSISADGRTMIFQSNRLDSAYKLFESRMDANGNWQTPIPINSINNFGDKQDLIGGPSISYDGNTLFFFASFNGGYGSEDIYYSVRENNEWSEPKNVGPPINSADYEGFPSISADGKSLYFIRINKSLDTNQPLYQRETCFEIFKSEKNEDGSWGIPEKLPFPINTGCEKSPRIMADNKTLIFSSVREGGIGSFDLYQSQVNDEGDWSDPVPLYYVNTKGSDQFSCISAAGDRMYFNTLGDIYWVTIPKELRQFQNNLIQGYVRDGGKNTPLEARIQVSDAATSEVIAQIDNNPSDGWFSLVLTTGRNYNLEVIKEGYTSARLNYDFRAVKEYIEYQENINIFPTVNLRLNVFDVELLEGIEATIDVRKKGSSAIFSQYKTSAKEEGVANVVLPLGDNFELFVRAENFQEEQFNFDLKGKVFYNYFERDLQLIPKKVNIQMNVSDIANNGKIKSKVRLKNKDRDEVIEVDGNEMVSLRVGDRYEIEASTDKGYFFASTTIEVDERGYKVAKSGTSLSAPDDATLTASSDNSLDFRLKKIEKNTNLELNDILFETNSAQLSEISFAELNRLIDMLQNNPEIIVEIGAHTDDVGAETYNRILSEKRAQSVVEFLTANNIPSSRFVAKGYGECCPVVENTSDENRARNRRVEVKILKSDN